jgi:S-formylglutathione hydrolase FrmB
MGVSIGGYGALKCALTFPKQYGYCYAFSSACLFLNEGLANARKDKNLFCKNYGESIYQDFRQNFQLKDSEESDLLSVAQANKDTKSLITLYCGSKDPFLQDNRRFKDELQKLGYNPSYEEWEGSHDFIFFNEALRKAVAKAEMHE